MLVLCGRFGWLVGWPVVFLLFCWLVVVAAVAVVVAVSVVVAVAVVVPVAAVMAVIVVILVTWRCLCELERWCVALAFASAIRSISALPLPFFTWSIDALRLPLPHGALLLCLCICHMEHWRLASALWVELVIYKQIILLTPLLYGSCGVMLGVVFIIMCCVASCA